MKLSEYVLALIFLFPGMLFGQSDTVSAENLRRHVNILASDALQGRGWGQPAERMVHSYLATEYYANRLVPLYTGNNYFQTFIWNVDDKSIFIEKDGMRFDTDLGHFFIEVPSAFNHDKKRFKVVRLTDSTDYSKIDANTLVVIQLEEPFRAKSANNFFRLRSNLIKEKAAGYIYTHPNELSYHQAKIFFESPEGMSQLLSLGMNNLRELGMHVPDFLLNTMITKTEEQTEFIAIQTIVSKNSIKNVVGMVPTEKPTGKFIIVGTHYDHIGIINDVIYNGADDNASGTAILLELGRIFSERARHGEGLNHHIMFVAFGAEEKGLLGSRNFMNLWSNKADSTIAMINFDMVGRLGYTKANELEPYGIASENIAQIADTLSKENNISINYSRGGSFFTGGYFERTDHYPFALKGIPFMSFVNQTTKDYHKPTDDIEKVNFEGMKTLTEFVVKLIDEIDRKPPKR